MMFEQQQLCRSGPRSSEAGRYANIMTAVSHVAGMRDLDTTHGTYLDTHDTCLDTHDTCLDTHDTCLDTYVSQLTTIELGGAHVVQAIIAFKVVST